LKKLLLLILLSGITSSQLLAGGFQLNEHGARAMGMGGAFTAISNDPSAIYFNGAGILQLNGTQFMLGTTLIAPVSSFRGVYPSITEYDTKKQAFFPSQFFVTHRFNDDVAVGLGFTSPFGLGTEWPDDWVGKYLAIKTTLNVFTISPIVSYKLIDNLFVSAGLVYSFANVDITKKSSQAPFASDAYTTLSGNDNAAFGFNLGAMYKPIEQLSFGVSFHSQLKYKFKGTGTTTGAPQLASLLPNGDVTADLTAPFNLAFGVAYDLLPELKVSFDFQYIGWSSYNELKIDFPDTSFIYPRNYQNSYILRLGAGYKINPDLSVLGGIYFDKNPVKPEYINPSLPDANRLGFSLGLDYKIIENLNVSASYLFIRASQLTVSDSQEYYTEGNAPFNGSYNSYANLFSLSLYYSL
jgi:long-chain fatty acid transport protein